MLAAENTYNTLHVLGMGSYDDGSSSQSFRLEIRILHDSIIWLDVADPILGIKVARAIVYQDSVAFVNRLEKEYFTGNVAELQKRFKLDFGFETLQGILSANNLFPINEKDFELYYRPGAYLLSDFNPDPKDGEDTMGQYLGRSTFRQVYVDPASYKPASQMLQEPSMGKSYTLENKEIKAANGIHFPETISLTYTQNETTLVRIVVKKVGTNEDGLSFPFNIPSSYAKMR